MRFIRRVVSPVAAAATVVTLSFGGGPAEPAGAVEGAASSAAVAGSVESSAAPALEPGCDTSRIPEGDWFLANTIVDANACRKCDELAWVWAARYGYGTLCVQITRIEAWLFIR